VQTYFYILPVFLSTHSALSYYYINYPKIKRENRKDKRKKYIKKENRKEKERKERFSYVIAPTVSPKKEKPKA